MNMNRRIGLVISIVVLLSFFLFHAVPGFAQEIKKGGTVIIGIGGNPVNLIPSNSYTLASICVSNVMFEALVNYDMKGNMVPELATSWNFSPDGKTWTFNLRKGVKWSDGKDLTSADVAFSIKEVAEKLHPLGKQAFGPISRIETPDPHTVVFKFDKPYSPTGAFLSCWFSGIIPKHLYEGTEVLKNPYNLKPVSSGPFIFEEYKPGSHVSMVRNPSYWRKDRPYLDKIIFKIIPDAAGRVAAFEKGEVDVLPAFFSSLSDTERLKERGFGTAVFQTSIGSMIQVLMNLDNKYLSDRKVRYALAHAVNREEIIKKAYFGFGKVPVGPIPSSVPWAFTDDVPRFDYNPAKANQILDEAGYKKGSDGIRFSIDFVFESTLSEFNRAAQIIQAQLREVGVDLRLKGMETAAAIDLVFRKRDFGMYYNSLSIGPDPAVGAGRLYLTSQIRATTGITNAMGYSNPEADQLFAEAGSASSRTAAAEKYKRIQKLLVQDMPCLWINEYPYVIAFNPKLAGLPAGPYMGTDHMESVGYKK
jgi:peptide/nickel transport system substrate-binding protein